MKKTFKESLMFSWFSMIETGFKISHTVLCILLCVFVFISCTEKQDVSPQSDTNSTIKTREDGSGETIISSSVFELHNDFIYWVFDNYSDSTDYYLSDNEDFMKFATRKWFQYTSEVGDGKEWLLENDQLLSSPSYTKNEGYTAENLFSSYWSTIELGYIYTTLDSVYDAIDNKRPESELIQLINNGKTRITTINPTHKNSLLNALTQASYSCALAHDLAHLNDPIEESALWCLVSAMSTDIQAQMVAVAYDGGAGHLDAVVYASLYAFALCWNS